MENLRKRRPSLSGSLYSLEERELDESQIPERKMQRKIPKVADLNVRKLFVDAMRAETGELRPEAGRAETATSAKAAEIFEKAEHKASEKKMPRKYYYNNRRRPRYNYYRKKRHFYKDALAMENRARVFQAIAAARADNAARYLTANPGKTVKSGRYRAILKGRGAYRLGGWLGGVWRKHRWGWIPRLAGAVGGALTTGTLAGATAGYQSGADFSKRILGLGAYSTDGPTYGGASDAMVMAGNVPSMHSVGENGVRICHKELIGTIYSTTGFNVEKYEVNPGLHATFPWLSGVARNFQQYNIEGMAFVYQPTCSDAISAGTVASMGSVSMSSDMNVKALDPTSTVGMLQSQFSVSGKPSTELIMPIEQDRAFGGRAVEHLLVRTGELPDGATQQFYDDCVAWVATDGNGAANVQLGQLFVTYDVVLVSPTSGGAGSEIPMARVIINPDGIDNAHPFGTAAEDWVDMTDTIGLDWTSGTTFTMGIGNSGVYQITLAYKTGAGVNGLGNITASMGGTALTPLTKWVNDSTTHYISDSVAANSNGIAECVYFNVTDPTKTTVFTMGPGVGFGAAPTSCDLVVTQVNPAILHEE